MKMPRFTAEESLYRTAECYHMVKTVNQADSAIYPAQDTSASTEGFFECYLDCNGVCRDKPACFRRCITKFC